MATGMCGFRSTVEMGLLPKVELCTFQGKYHSLGMLTRGEECVINSDPLRKTFTGAEGNLSFVKMMVCEKIISGYQSIMNRWQCFNGRRKKYQYLTQISFLKIRKVDAARWCLIEGEYEYGWRGERMICVDIPLFSIIQPLKFIRALTFTLTYLLFPLGQLVTQPLYHGPERIKSAIWFFPLEADENRWGWRRNNPNSYLLDDLCGFLVYHKVF